jgi:hypothetical protein
MTTCAGQPLQEVPLCEIENRGAIIGGRDNSANPTSSHSGLSSLAATTTMSGITGGNRKKTYSSKELIARRASQEKLTTHVQAHNIA